MEHTTCSVAFSGCLTANAALHKTTGSETLWNQVQKRPALHQAQSRKAAYRANLQRLIHKVYYQQHLSCHCFCALKWYYIWCLWDHFFLQGLPWRIDGANLQKEGESSTAALPINYIRSEGTQLWGRVGWQDSVHAAGKFAVVYSVLAQLWKPPTTEPATQNCHDFRHINRRWSKSRTVTYCQMFERAYSSITQLTIEGNRYVENNSFLVCLRRTFIWRLIFCRPLWNFRHRQIR